MALTDNLAGYWKLDESSGNASDSSGNGFTLTNNNTVAFSSGKINNGADFVATSNESLTTARSVSDALDITGDITFSFWAKQANWATCAADGAIISTYNLAANKRKYEVILQSNESVRVQYAQNDSTSSHWDFDVSGYGTNTWVHFFFAIDVSAKTIIAYINGSSISPSGGAQSATSIQSSDATFALGMRPNPAAHYYTGSIDEVGIWSVQLTADDATTLYNSGSGLTYPFTTTKIKKFNGIEYAKLKKINGVAIANVKKLNGIS